jgi:hypothetical protein
VEGGLIDGIPLYLPWRGFSRLAIQIGILERRLARLPGLREALCPNILMEFERICSESGRECGASYDGLHHPT